MPFDKLRTLDFFVFTNLNGQGTIGAADHECSSEGVKSSGGR